MFLDPVAQRIAAQTEQLGGPGDVALGTLEGFGHHAFFHFDQVEFVCGQRGCRLDPGIGPGQGAGLRGRLLLKGK